MTSAMTQLPLIETALASFYYAYRNTEQIREQEQTSQGTRARNGFDSGLSTQQATLLYSLITEPLCLPKSWSNRFRLHNQFALTALILLFLIPLRKLLKLVFCQLIK